MWNLATLFRRDKTPEWTFHFPVGGDLVMRRRDADGHWEYRPPTDDEAEEFDSLRAW